MLVIIGSFKQRTDVVRIITPHVEPEKKVLTPLFVFAVRQQDLSEMAEDRAVAEVAAEIDRAPKPVLGLIEITQKGLAGPTYQPRIDASRYDQRYGNSPLCGRQQRFDQ